MLIFVSIVMTAIFSFSAGRIVYDPTLKQPSKIVSVSPLDTVIDVASKRIELSSK